MTIGPDLAPHGAVTFHCDVTRVEGDAIAWVHGELDLATAPVFLRQVLATLVPPVDRITVDLRHVEFIDSSGTSSLVQVRTRAEELGVAFVLASVPPQPRRVLEVTGLAESFGLYAPSD